MAMNSFRHLLPPIFSRALLVAAGLLCVTGSQAGGAESFRRLTPAELEDRVRGGWAGQMIGVAYGAPTEFRFLGRTIDGDIPWKPEQLENTLHQDDLYVEMTFAEVMDRIGLDATTQQYGEAFRDSKYPLWHANAAARRLLQAGIPAPWSGHPKYNLHANDIDFQIESDFIGLMTPGLPQEASRYCDRVGRVMNYGDGLYGGTFVTAMYSAAYFERDPRRVVEQGLAALPPGSGYARIIQDVLAWHRDEPKDWRLTWQKVQARWDRDDSCSGGALQPFNIDARLNGAYIAIGLLYGGGDFARTVEISARCGQDSDCNPSSAAGVLGVMLGYERLPAKWKEGIPALAAKKFDFTNYSFNDIVRSTVARARQVVTRAGGSWSDTEITIPAQSPRPPKLEQWSMGAPLRIVPAASADWSWCGEWSTRAGRLEGRTPLDGKFTAAPGQEGTLTFEGTGVALVGPHAANGGQAEVYLDGKKQGRVNFYIPKDTTDEGVWQAYGLKPGRHAVRLVTTTEADPSSKGRECYVLGAIIYGKE